VVVHHLQALFGEIDERLVRLTNSIVVLFAPPTIILGVTRRLRRPNPFLDAVVGVLCVYLLLGMFFSSVYGAVDHLGGKPFFAQGTGATIAHCTYFSFTTLATIGYGDLTAASNVGHTLSVTEGPIGQIYLVTIVSVIVSNVGRRRTPPKAPEGGEARSPSAAAPARPWGEQRWACASAGQHEPLRVRSEACASSRTGGGSPQGRGTRCTPKTSSRRGGLGGRR
jgi:hypothetical protein